MTGIGQRKQELECQQRTLEIQIEKIQIQSKSLEESQFEREREVRGLQRKLTNVKMRLRSMNIKKMEKGQDRLSTSLLAVKMSNSSICNMNNDKNNCTNININVDSESSILYDSTRSNLEFKEATEIDNEFDPNDFHLVHQRPVRRLFPSIPLPHANLMWGKNGYVAKWRHVFDTGSFLAGKTNGHFQNVEKEDFQMKIEMIKPGKRNIEYEKPKDGKIVSNKPIISWKLNSKIELGLKRTEAEVSDCNCQRPAVSISCDGGCGFTFRGRLCVPCPAHPGHRHLMDHNSDCPQCGKLLVENTSDFAESNNNSYLAPNFCVIKPKLQKKK